MKAHMTQAPSPPMTMTLMTSSSTVILREVGSAGAGGVDRGWRGAGAGCVRPDSVFIIDTSERRSMSAV